jgi:hypothetical protein
MDKRTESVTVKMSEADWEIFARAAEHIWPGAPLSRSSIVLALARLGAKAALGTESQTKPKRTGR